MKADPLQFRSGSTASQGGPELKHGAGRKPGTMSIKKEIKMKNFIASVILPKAKTVRNHYENH
jgi:hypothetical protein